MEPTNIIQFPVKHSYIHTHQLPEDAPHGWGTAYKHFVRKYADIPGQLDSAEIPTQKEFWTNEVEQCKKNLDSAVTRGNDKEIDRLFDQLFIAESRFNKETSNK